MKQYPKYKESGIQWIGQVPEHWEVSKLKYFVECKDGYRVPIENSLREEGPYPYWGAGSITGYVKDFIFDEELVLLGEDGAPFFDKNRPVAFYSNEKIWVNNHIHVLKPKNSIRAKFLTYLLNSVDFAFYINGSILSKLTQSNMDEIVILLPPLSEQEAIAAYLDKQTGKIDKSIESLAQQKTDLQQYRTSLISEAVTRGLNPNTTLKDSGVQWIGQIPEEWEVSKLKYVLRVNGRVGFKGYTTADLVSEGEGAYTIGGKHITNCVLDLSNADYISWDKYYESPEIMVKTGDIVMAQRGTLGKAALIKEDIGPATINPSLVLLNEISINNVFLLYYLLSKPIQEWIGLMNTATAVPMISQNQIDNMPIPVPSLPEQEAIAAYLDERMGKIDTAIATIDRQIADLRAYRTALITEAVTGKVDVRVSV